MTMWIILVFVFSIYAVGCYAGECCDAYYDLTFTLHGQTWCDDYCCGASALGALKCCDSIFLVAPDEDRSGFCLDYFAKNIWAPILIGLGGLGALLTCIACCYCCCHSNNRSGAVIAPAQQPYHTNVMLLNPQGAQQPVYNPSTGAYPVHPGPSVIEPVPEAQQTATKHPFES